METKFGKPKIPKWVAVFFCCSAIIFMVISILSVFKKPILRRLNNDKIIKEAITLSLLEQENPWQPITIPISEINNEQYIQKLTDDSVNEHFSLEKKSWQLTSSDYKKIKELYISDPQVYDISLLSKLTNLEMLQFYDVKVSNLEPIANLKNLKELRLRKLPVENIEPLMYLKDLQKLQLFEMPITNIEPLINLTKLEDLRLYDVNVKNLDVLFNLKNLKHLQLSIPISKEQKEELQKALPNLKIN